MNERIEKAAREIEKDIALHHAEKYLAVNHSKSNNSDFQAAMNIAVIKAYIAGWIESKLNQWISVDEELPPIDEKCVGFSIDVIVRNEYGKVTTAWYSYSAQNWHLCYGEIQGDDLIYSKITHWMPIPALPERSDE